MAGVQGGECLISGLARNTASAFWWCCCGYAFLAESDFCIGSFQKTSIPPPQRKYEVNPPPSLDGRNFLHGGSLDLFWNDPFCGLVVNSPESWQNLRRSSVWRWWINSEPCPTLEMVFYVEMKLFRQIQMQCNSSKNQTNNAILDFSMANALRRIFIAETPTIGNIWRILYQFIFHVYSTLLCIKHVLKHMTGLLD
jgi:hypothetical protein